MRMKKFGKRILSSVLTICMLVSLLSGLTPAYAAGSNSNSGTSQRTRDINIAYDDSGSMYNDERWSEAQYALQVFTAMMGENDTMNIHYLNGNSAVEMKGSGNAQTNVNDIYTRENDGGGTPYSTVQEAADALMQSTADEKWLIVLTDGAFDDGSAADVLNYVGENDTRVIYIAVGDGAVSLNDYAREMFYPYQTSESTSILDVMTDAASKVFNYRSVNLNGVGTGTVSFDTDVPLAKLIIFVQGENANVGNVRVNGTDIQAATDSAVNVHVDAGAGDAAFGAPIASGLKGVVYTAVATDSDHPFAEGTYSFDCNVSNVQVFVEPGIDIRAVLRNDAGETINIGDDGASEISEGDWVVDVELINPLTGAVIDPSKTSILSGATTNVVVTDDQGITTEYNTGDVVTISGKSVEFYGSVTYQGMNGTVTKNSDVHKLGVVKSKLYISFDQPGVYDLDAVMLQPNEDLKFHITINGKGLTAEQADAVNFHVEDTDGISWDVQKIDDTGYYQLIPSYAKHKGVAAVNGGTSELTVSATLKDNGDKREGTGTVAVNINTETSAGLQLTLTMPDETVQDKTGKTYMFDCRQLGTPTGEAGDTERPYILVEVQALNADGSARQLTDEEWEEGVNNFKFAATEQYPNFAWKLGSWFVGGQWLNFAVVKGDAPSTYKLYLDGILKKNVLPNTSDLTVTLTYKYDNGAKLSGSADGVVSVRPLPLWQYLVWLLAILAVVFMVSIWAVKMATKPRFPRDFKPWIYTTCVLNGAPQPMPGGSRKAKYKKTKRWSFTKPETCSVSVDDKNGTGITCRFRVTAVNRTGDFKLESITSFASYASGTTLGGITYAKLNESGKTKDLEFDMYGTEFKIQKSRGPKHFTVKVSFNGNPSGGD